MNRNLNLRGTDLKFNRKDIVISVKGGNLGNYFELIKLIEKRQSIIEVIFVSLSKIKFQITVRYQVFL